MPACVMRRILYSTLPLCFISFIIGCSGDTSDSPSSGALVNNVDQFSELAPAPPACEPTQTTGTMSGMVKESVQGFAIWGAQVAASQAGVSPVRTFTNEQGAFLLCGLPPGTYEVAASAPGFESSQESTRENVLVLAGTQSERIDLQLTLSSQQPPSNVGAVSGRVVSAQAPDSAIQGVHVEAWVDTEISNNQITAGKKVNETLTNEKGEFFLTLNVGAYTLAIYKEGFVPNPKLIIAVVIRSESVTTLPKDILLFPG